MDTIEAPSCVNYTINSIETHKTIYQNDSFDVSLSQKRSKSSAKTKVVTCPQTGEITTFELRNQCGKCNDFVEKKEGDARFERYALQSAARKILYNQKHPRGHSHSWRVADCLRGVSGADVRVLMSLEYQKAHYGNLRVCGSVWTCPVCAAKISEYRKKEIETAASVHTEAGGFMYMVTYTFSHSRNDDLGVLLGDYKTNKGLAGALQRLRDSRGYKKLLEQIDHIGLIRNLEVTHGEANGWHPHVHELWLVNKKLSGRALIAFKNALFELWHKACEKSGLALPNRQRGVDIVIALDPAEYLQKWGREQKWSIGSELAKSHVKKAFSGGRTPFDLIRLYLSEPKKADYYASLFRDYAVSFFGKRQCYWTNGLKNLFLIQDRTDEEIALDNDDKAIEIATISKEDWKKVLKNNYEARAIILRLAETGGADAVKLFIDSL